MCKNVLYSCGRRRLAAVPKLPIASVLQPLARGGRDLSLHVDTPSSGRAGDKSRLTCHRFRYVSLAAVAEHREINSWNCWTSESFADAADASSTRSVSEMLRQTSPKAASGGTGFAMLPSAHRKPERRDYIKEAERLQKVMAGAED